MPDRPKRDLPAYLAALLTAVVIFPLAFLLGRGTTPRPDLASELTPSIYAVQNAEGTLGRVDLEYARAVGTRHQHSSRTGSSLAAARAAAARGLADLDQATDLARLYPGPARTANDDFAALIRAIDQRAPLAEISTLTGELRADLAVLIPAL